MSSPLEQVMEHARRELTKTIVGQADALDLLIVTVICGGHALVEGVPGLAKTLAVRTLARLLRLQFQRVQGTPDLMPADITGSSVFNMGMGTFALHQGPVFTDLLLVDEINRMPPRTQAALLECMEERQVTVDNATYQLEKPFMVIATQNPIEMEGTYALPEAQRDRFMARVSVGYPVESAEIAMLEGHTAHNPLDDLEPVTDAGEIRKVIEIVGRVHVSPAVQRYAVALTTATRASNDLHLGASPRATLHLVRAAKAVAATQGRDYVLPDDIHGITTPVLAHRLLPNVEATMSGRTTAAILAGIVESVPVPDAHRA